MGDSISVGPGDSRASGDRSSAEISGERSDLADSLRELSQLATGFLPLKAMLTPIARVSGSMRMRVTTAMWRARFKRRSPPRLIRWRTVFPEDAA